MDTQDGNPAETPGAGPSGQAPPSAGVSREEFASLLASLNAIAGTLRATNAPGVVAPAAAVMAPGASDQGPGENAGGAPPPNDGQQRERAPQRTPSDAARHARAAELAEEIDIALELTPGNPYVRTERVQRRLGTEDVIGRFDLGVLDPGHPVLAVAQRQMRGRTSGGAVRNLKEFVAWYPLMSYMLDLKHLMRADAIECGESKDIRFYQALARLADLAEERMAYLENVLRSYDPEADPGERALYAHEAERYGEEVRVASLSTPAMRERMAEFQRSREASILKQLAKGAAAHKLPSHKTQDAASEPAKRE